VNQREYSEIVREKTNNIIKKKRTGLVVKSNERADDPGVICDEESSRILALEVDFKDWLEEMERFVDAVHELGFSPEDLTKKYIGKKKYRCKNNSKKRSSRCLPPPPSTKAALTSPSRSAKAA